MSNEFVNPFQVQLPTEEEEEDRCAICQEGLSTAQTYQLPECHHTFHTHCIVTWFRSRPSNNEGTWSDITQGGSCPCCGNRGINNQVNETKQRRYHRRRWTPKELPIFIFETTFKKTKMSKEIS